MIQSNYDLTLWKRLLDLAGATVGITLLLPAWILISIAIKIDEGSPILFRQYRMGRFQKPFEIIKFRTMSNQKVTKMGRWLRATGLDETLQLLLVIRGDMHLVGPRPLTQTDIERIGWTEKRHLDRWNVKPGITGLAQLYSGRGARVSLYLDRWYITNQSMRLDLFIIFISALVNLFGKKRVQRWMIYWRSFNIYVSSNKIR